MPITANTLYRDSFNFLRNQLPSILLLAFLSALITVMLHQAFIPDADQLKMLSTAEDEITSSASMGIKEIMSQMTPEQHMVLLRVLAVAAFSALVGNVLLVGSLLILLALASQGRRVSALQAMTMSLPTLPRLFLLIFICTLFIQLGLTLFIVPGVAIAIAVCLAPVIISNERTGIFAAIKISAKLAFANTRLIAPAMMLWLTARLILLFFISYLTILPPTISSIILSVLNNLVSALLLVYLFRLYMLLRNQIQL